MQKIEKWRMQNAVSVNIAEDGRTVVLVNNEFAVLMDLGQLDNLCAAIKQTIIKVAEKCGRPVIEIATDIPKLPSSLQ